MTTLETTGHMIDAHTMYLKDPVPEMNRELSITVREKVAEKSNIPDVLATLEKIGGVATSTRTYPAHEGRSGCVSQGRTR